VNGTLLTKKVDLNHLDRVTFGHSINFKLIIPGKGSLDDLRVSMNTVGKYGDYIDDKIGRGTL